MPESTAALPQQLVAQDVATGTVRLEVDASLYPLEALYGAAYTFIDRCYVLLDKPTEHRFRVSLTPKEGGFTAEDLRAVAGEFSNELLSCAWRGQIAQQNRALIEQVTMKAIAGAMGPPSLEELAKFDFTDAPLDDPLGIATSWEEKYKKKKDKPAAEGDKP